MPSLQEQFGQIDIYLFDQLLRGRIPPGSRILDAGCGSGRNLVYFLREIVPKKADWNAKWGRILEVYFKTLQGTSATTPPSGDKPTTGGGETPDAPAMGDPGDAKRKKGGGNVAEAMRAAFEGVDWAELEAAWKSAIASVPG